MVSLRSTVAALLVVTSALPAQKVTFTDTRLKNGLRLIVAEDHNAPTYSIAVSYNVGSRDERKGRTGFAHLFEHMMFKGSENVGPGEHFTLIFNNGGNMNGTTNKDRTLYYETLPSNQLDLGLFLEADRMKSLVINKENLANQINAVQEERRLGVDNQAYGRTYEAIDSLAYSNFAYQHSVIGSMADLSAASVEDVAAFFKTYYAPNNAVVAIVGDVKTAEVIAKAKKYFEPIARQKDPDPVDMTEPAPGGEKRLDLEDALARQPQVDITWIVPPSANTDAAALSVLANVLGGGRSGRLYENVVRQQQLATGIGASKSESRGPGTFQFFIAGAPGKSPAEVEKAALAELEKVKRDGVHPWEVQKARSSARRAMVSRLQSTLQRAVLLSQNALFYDDPNRINTRADMIAAVTAADVQRVANQYLTDMNRSVITTTPKAAFAPGDK